MRKLVVSLLIIAIPSLAQTALGPRNYIGTHPWKVHTKSIALLEPTTSDSATVSFQLPRDSTVARVSCAVMGTGTVSINLNKRAENAPNTNGTNVLSSDLVCDNNSQTSCSSGCDVNTISSGGITARQLVVLTISAVSGTPNSVVVHVELNDN